MSLKTSGRVLPFTDSFSPSREDVSSWVSGETPRAGIYETHVRRSYVRRPGIPPEGDVRDRRKGRKMTIVRKAKRYA